MQTKIHLVTRILVPEKPRVMRKPRNAGTRCMYIVVAVGLSGILKAKQKLGVTFNFNKQDVIDFITFIGHFHGFFGFFDTKVFFYTWRFSTGWGYVPQVEKRQ